MGRGRVTGASWIWPLLVSVVFTHTALNLARPLVSYRTIALGGDAVAVGLVTAAYALLPLLVAVPLGRATDRARRTAWIVGLGAAILGTGCLLLAHGPGLLAIAAASTVLGMGHLLCMVAGQGLIARLSAPEHLDRDFGWFTAAASLGQLAGPLLSGAILADASGDALLSATSSALLVAAATGGLGLVPILALARVRMPPPSRRKGSARTPARDLLRRPGLPSGLLASLALLSAVDILTAYLPLVAENRGIPPVLVGVLLSLRAGFSLLSRLVLSRLVLRWSRETLIAVSTAAAGLSMAAVALPVSDPFVLGTVLSVGGFLLGLGQPLTMSAVATAAPEGSRGAALALRIWGNRLGQVGIPAVGAGVAGAVGASGALWFAAAVLMASAVTAARRV
ncbi:MFS transporter [Nocardiopsis sp. TSRI0078]|uniref:MFS transporter n=1 Tax=unclassified Nocardiopsis TaxID=2649073 RepID=UPI00093ED457|nr:MFS transporter [Nocardiopsis sp. TSRI0078]OKI15723.1 MFS transporter [Nocardiopsis sp. TSRI0078]